MFCAIARKESSSISLAWMNISRTISSHLLFTQKMCVHGGRPWHSPYPHFFLDDKRTRIVAFWRRRAVEKRKMFPRPKMIAKPSLSSFKREIQWLLGIPCTIMYVVDDRWSQSTFHSSKGIEENFYVRNFFRAPFLGFYFTVSSFPSLHSHLHRWWQKIHIHSSPISRFTHKKCTATTFYMLVLCVKVKTLSRPRKSPSFLPSFSSSQS